MAMGKRAKKECRINAIEFPRYSPDLNPLDYSLWDNILDRMDRTAPKGPESKAAYAKRLRRTALRTSRRAIAKAVRGMKKRIHAVYDAKGGDIDID